MPGPVRVPAVVPEVVSPPASRNTAHPRLSWLTAPASPVTSIEAGSSGTAWAGCGCRATRILGSHPPRQKEGTTRAAPARHPAPAARPMHAELRTSRTARNPRAAEQGKAGPLVDVSGGYCHRLAAVLLMRGALDTRWLAQGVSRIGMEPHCLIFELHLRWLGKTTSGARNRERSGAIDSVSGRPIVKKSHDAKTFFSRSCYRCRAMIVLETLWRGPLSTAIDPASRVNRR